MIDLLVVKVIRRSATTASSLMCQGRFSHLAGRALLLAAGLWGQLAYAVVPESGIYWKPDRAGSGYVLDHQRGVISFAVYSYEADGDPVYYVGSGVLRDDAEALPGIDPPPSTEGYYPLHWVEIDLYRSAGGSCAPCDPPVFGESTKVGSVQLFFPDLGRIFIANLTIEIDGDVGYKSSIVAERVNFSRGRYATSSGYMTAHDLEGSWVFVDAKNPGSSAIRMNLAAVSFADGSPNEAPHTFTYLDEPRQIVVTCVFGYPRDVLPKDGCEFNIGGSVAFSVQSSDIGLNRLQGAAGALPDRMDPLEPTGPYRNSGEIVGVRVETSVGD